MRVLGDWLLLPQRFALHAPSATAVLADVHLGYSAARQRLGDAIPWRTVAEDMQPLAEAVRIHDIRALVVAGDLFERRFDTILWQQWLEVLDRLQIRFAGLVPGNHDGGVEHLPEVYPAGFNLAGWEICHGDQPVEPAQAVTGHWHPAMRWRRRKVPCFLAHGQHLILPAFSLDAAGVDVDADPRWRDWDRYMICDANVVHVTDARSSGKR